MGASIMMAADIAIAADDAYVALAFTRIGLAGDCGATYHLPRLIGERRALELMLPGERIDARRAADIGLVTRDRTSVVEGTRVAVRVDLGGRGSITKKTLTFYAQDDR